MFEWYKHSDKSAPQTREEAAELLAGSYGMETFKSPQAGVYQTWVACNGDNGAPELNYAYGEQFAAPVEYPTPDALLDRMQMIAPWCHWAVIEETGEPNTEPIY